MHKSDVDETLIDAVDEDNKKLIVEEEATRLRFIN